MRIEPIVAAAMYIDKFHPDCEAAVLAGSVVRGEATATSDLDIVVFDEGVHASYRESILFQDWPIEVFVHNLSSYQPFFESDCARARPSLPAMVSEGMVLKDLGVLVGIKAEADLLLAAGPKKWTPDEIGAKRYFITDALDDFTGSESKAELLFIAGHLAELLAEFVLRTNRQWTGQSKWVYRSLQKFDPGFAEALSEAFGHFYRTGDKDPVIRLAEEALSPFGGKLFDGFSAGKRKERI